MKRIIGICLLLLMMPMAIAETNVSTWIHSDETVNYWANIDADGDANIQINGVDWEDQYGNVTVNNYETTEVKGSGFNVWDMTRHLEETVECFLGEKKFCSEWNFRIFNSLARVFLLRQEQYQVNDNFDVRLAAVEKTLENTNAEAYCQGKIDVMLERDLSWVKCDNTTYRNVNGKAIAIVNATIT